VSRIHAACHAKSVAKGGHGGCIQCEGQLRQYAPPPRPSESEPIEVCSDGDGAPDDESTEEGAKEGREDREDGSYAGEGTDDDAYDDEAKPVAKRKRARAQKPKGGKCAHCFVGDAPAMQADVGGDAPAVPADSFGQHFPVKMQAGPTQKKCCRCANLVTFGCQHCGKVLCCKWRLHNVPNGSGGFVQKWRTCHGLHHSHADSYVRPVTTRLNARPQLGSSDQDFGPIHMLHAPLSLKVLRAAGTRDPRGFQPTCVCCGAPTVFVCPCPECADVNGLPSALCWNTAVRPGMTPICFVKFHDLTPEAREQLKCDQRQRPDWNSADYPAYLNALAEYQ
jgi:hypothetical protein